MYNASHHSPGGSYVSPAMAHYHGSALMFQDGGHMGFHRGNAPDARQRSASPSMTPPTHALRPAPWEQAAHTWVGHAPPSSFPNDAHMQHPEMRHPHSLPPMPMPSHHHSQAGNGHDQPPDAYHQPPHAVNQPPGAYHKPPEVYHHHPDAYQPLTEEHSYHEEGQLEQHPLDHRIPPHLDADKSLIEARKRNGLERPAYHSNGHDFQIEDFPEGDPASDSPLAPRDVSRHYFYKSHPDGNLYRGWAIGLQSGFRQLVLTLSVLVVQLIGPVLMLQWAWEALNEEGNPVSLYKHWKDHGFKVTELELKLLGTVLMVLIYFNADQLLSNKDCQTIRLIQLYEDSYLNRKWIVIDAFCNSWVIAMLAPATPALLWTRKHQRFSYGCFRTSLPRQPQQLFWRHYVWG